MNRNILVVYLLVAILVLSVFGFRYMTRMPGSSYAGANRPLSAEEGLLRERLGQHVQMLAGTIGERNWWRLDAFRQAADYCERVLSDYGLDVKRRHFQTRGKAMSNLEVVLAGSRRPDEVLVVGAHYDSVAGSPGANDNASGVAAVLEMARLLRDRPPARTVRLVLFANEEPPFFQTPDMGSRIYAEEARRRDDRIVGMFSIETIGYFSDEPGSQRYPFPFHFFYPDTGDFIAFVANLSSRGLVQRSIEAFRSQAPFPSEGVAAPGWMMGIGWSDHWSFWRVGYPAVMVTDTALFRYPYYHAATDTPDRLDYARLARVVAGLARMISRLADTP